MKTAVATTTSFTSRSQQFRNGTQIHKSQILRGARREENRKLKKNLKKDDVERDVGVFCDHAYMWISLRNESEKQVYWKEKEEENDEKNDDDDAFVGDERYWGFGKIVDSKNVKVNEEEEMESVDCSGEAEET